MSMLPEMFGAEATPHAIEFPGKKYSFRPITFGLLEQMEVAHFEQAKARLKAMKDVLDEDTYAKKGIDLYEQYNAGEFGFFAERGQKWARSPAGATHLLKLCLGISDEELVPLFLHKGEEIKRLMDMVIYESGLQGAGVAGAAEATPGAEGAVGTPFRPGAGNP